MNDGSVNAYRIGTLKVPDKAGDKSASWDAFFHGSLILATKWSF